MTLPDGRAPLVPGEQVPHFVPGSAAVPDPTAQPSPIDQTRPYPVLEEAADHAGPGRRWTRRRKQALGAAVVILILLLCAGGVAAVTSGRDDLVDVPAPEVVSSAPPATRAALGDAEAAPTPTTKPFGKKAGPKKKAKPKSKRPRKG